MPRFSNVVKETTQDVTIPIDGSDEPLILTVITSRFTVGWQKQLKEIAKSEDIGAMADAFFGTVKKWNLETDEGTPMPLDASSIDQLSVEAFMGIVTGMTAAISPKDQGAASTTKSKS